MKNNLIEQLIKEYGKVNFEKEFNKLSINQKKVLKLRYIDENYTLDNVAENLNSTREKVRNIEAKSIAFLKRNLEKNS